MDENEIKAVSDAMNELRETGTLSAESLAKLGGSGDTAKKSLEKFSSQVLGAGQKMGSLAGQIAQGQGSFASLGGTIEATTKLMGGLLSALPLVGGAAKALAEGVGQASKFVLDQLDTMAKNYQTLGDASAGAVDGIDGLMRQFNQMGNYSLPAFTKAVKNNTLGLASLKGTAALGAEELSKLTGVLTTGQTAERFLKLGISLDAVGDATAEYLGNMSRYGLTQGDTTEELTKKTQNYIIEVDKIARLTGQSRQAQEQIAQKNLADSRYRAKISEMRAQGQVNEAKQLELFVRGLGAINPALADAARATVTGTYLTKQSAEADIVLNGAIRRNLIAIEQGADATSALADAQNAAGEGADRFRTLFKYGKDLGGVGVAVFDTEALLLRRNELEKEGLTRDQAIAQAQKEQMEASGGLTDDFTRSQLAIAGSSKKIQELGFTLATRAVPAVETFAEGLESLTEFINDHFGNIASSKKIDAQNQANWNNMKAGSKAMHLVAVGLEKTADFIGLSTIARNAREARIASETQEFGPKAKGGNVDSILDTIKQRESRGNYSAQNPYSTASGAYQFVDKTWQSLTKKFGIGTEYNKAKLAPKEIQDAIAKSYVQDILSRAGGDVSKVPLEWYTGNIQGNLGGANIAPGHPSVSAYQSDWMKDYNRISGPSSGYKSSNIPTASSAGTETTVKSEQVSAEKETGNLFDKFGKKLDEMIAQQRQTNVLNSKLLQQAKS